MTFFDYAVLVVVGVSVLLAVVRGAVREVLALGGWVAAFFLANAYAGTVQGWLPASIANPAIRYLGAYLAIFLAVLVGMSLVSFTASKLVRTVGLGWLDRSVGALFGLVRGGALVLLGVLGLGMTQAPQQPFWRHSALGAPLVAMASQLKPWLPVELARRIHFEQGRSGAGSHAGPFRGEAGVHGR
ncbi:MAG: CvpA family protein [Betaproteobacteria bacterium]|nr:CvpA family protein [Betaproteobacteria bacterium]